MSELSCKNCHLQMDGNFCANCGEKKFTEHDLSISKLIQHLFISITDLDGKLLRSVGLLLVRPGQLSHDYLIGKRKSRLNPFQLFVLVNICYFFFISFYQQNTFNTPLNIHLSAENFLHKNIANELVREKLILSGESMEGYQQRFDSQINIQSKSLVILMIPIFAIVIFIFFIKEKNSGVKSLVYATHFYSFMLLFQIGIALLIAGLSELIGYFFDFNLRSFLVTEVTMSLTLLVAFFWYLFLSATRVFVENTWMLVLKSFLLAFSIYWIVLIYRMILFFTTFYTLE